ncbi:hypothetical protein D3C85_1439590 [compost metagenome]
MSFSAPCTVFRSSRRVTMSFSERMAPFCMMPDSGLTEASMPALKSVITAYWAA